LDPSENPQLPKSLSTALQLRIAHFRVLALHTFSGYSDHHSLLKEAAQKSLTVLDDHCSVPDMAKFGRAFTYNYLYAKWVTGSSSNERVERWIEGSVHNIHDVCLLLYQSDRNEVSDR
jgi:hypothetical protein